jgi:hypothetical protein
MATKDGKGFGVFIERLVDRSDVAINLDKRRP